MADTPLAAPGRIFISYRREETAYPAGWLYDRLADRFDSSQIFKDIDSIELGDDFVEVIATAVGSCDVLLALIGNEWLTITGEDGRRRLDDPADFVRLEIEAALVRDVRVIPVLVDEASMPRAEDLPSSLATLVRRQALELSPSRFDFDTGRLLRVLDRTVAEVRGENAATAPAAPVPMTLDTGLGEPPSALATPPDRPRRPRRRRMWAASIAAVAAVLVIGAIVLSTGDDPDDQEQADEYIQAFSEGSDTTECVARAIVDALGLGQIEAVATPDEIRKNPDVLGTPSEDQANAFFDNLSDCPEDRTYLVALASGVIRDGQTLTPDRSACVRREIDEDLARRILVDWWTETGNPNPIDELTAVIQPCLDPLRLVPDSGPPGAVIEVSGEPCAPPDGWTNGGVAFGMYDKAGNDTIPGIDMALEPDGSWQGQLPLPDGTAAGIYYVWANCYGDSSDGQKGWLHLYRHTAFELTDA